MNKKDSFASGVISLIFSQIIIKILGLIYSMYLVNKQGFGDEGNAIYLGAFQVYALILTICSIGVPNAISKIVSERIAKYDLCGANKIFKVSLIMFGGIGLFCGSVLYYFAADIAKYILVMPECEYGLIALSPAIFFASILAVFRGYFNGIQEVFKTAKIQMFEQIVKTTFTIIIVEIFSRIVTNNINIMMGAGANFATTIATIFCCIYSIKICRTQSKYDTNSQQVEQGILDIVKEIFSIAIPITLGCLIAGLSKNIDSITVVRILKEHLGQDIAKTKYGMITSKIDVLVAMPLSFNLAISSVLIPSVSKSVALKDNKMLKEKLNIALKFTSIIAIPASFRNCNIF